MKQDLPYGPKRTTPKQRSGREPDQQGRIQMPDRPDERRHAAEYVGSSGDDAAIEMALEITLKWIVGDQEAQDDDRTQRQAGAARARQGPGDEDRCERHAE